MGAPRQERQMQEVIAGLMPTWADSLNNPNPKKGRWTAARGRVDSFIVQAKTDTEKSDEGIGPQRRIDTGEKDFARLKNHASVKAFAMGLSDFMDHTSVKGLGLSKMQAGVLAMELIEPTVTGVQVRVSNRVHSHASGEDFTADGMIIAFPNGPQRAQHYLLTQEQGQREIRIFPLSDEQATHLLTPNPKNQESSLFAEPNYVGEDNRALVYSGRQNMATWNEFGSAFMGLSGQYIMQVTKYQRYHPYTVAEGELDFPAPIIREEPAQAEQIDGAEQQLQLPEPTSGYPALDPFGEIPPHLDPANRRGGVTTTPRKKSADNPDASE